LPQAYRAQARLSVSNIREIPAALRELIRLLLDDQTTPPETPPGGWQH
jgi:hypothetical protein